MNHGAVEAEEAIAEMLLGLREFLGKREDAISAGPVPFELDRVWWQQLADLGLFGLALPEDQDGLGMGLAELARAFEVLGEHRAPGPLIWTQLAAYVDPAVASGDLVVAGVDLTVLRPGDSVLVPHFEDADRLLVLWDDAVRLFDTKDIESELLDSPIDPETPVSRIGFLPDSAPVGGPDVATRLRRLGGLLTASTMLGVSQSGIDIAVAYAKERHQFGRPIGSFQALKHLLADSYARTNLARAAVYAAAELEGADAGAEGIDLLSAQLLAAKAADKNSRTAIQVFGGMGFAWETRPHLLLKRTWVLEHDFGTTGEHALAIADVIGDHMPEAVPETTAANKGSLVVEAADGVLTIRLNRPERKNALDQASQRQFVEVLEAAAIDESLRVIHLTGSGDDFCSGSDWVAANKGEVKPRPASLVRRLPLQSHRIIELLLTIQLPVVASVRGTAAGMGCQLALAADFALAADDATLWEPFVLRGFTPDTGATWLLPRLAGLARARRMLLLGEKVSGATAADWGLIHEAVPANDLDQAALELVKRLAAGPTVAIGLTKQQLVRSATATLPEALVDESYALELAARTADFREGLKAFSERRDPNFEGR